MNYEKCIPNVLARPQGHEIVSVRRTEGQLSLQDHMIWLKAVPESYFTFVVCVCVCVCVCECVSVRERERKI